MRIKLILISGLLFLMLQACNQNETAESSVDEETGKETLSTDVVKNPETASETAGDTDTDALPVMTFSETEHDFGTITEGDVVEYVFAFTNTGKTDLIITSAKGSCGCTVPSYPKTPIKPGEGGEIKVVFNSANKKGKQRKTVTITANTNPKENFIYITADVLPKETDQ